jgi:hypothetical protein
VTLIQDTAWILSHYRPDPDLLEATRTAVTLSAAYTFFTQGPHTLRPLVTLQRLPPAPPDTLVRAAAVVLGAASKDRSALYALGDSDEPLVAGAANGSSRRCGPGGHDVAEDARRRVQRGFTAASVGRSRGRGIQAGLRPPHSPKWNTPPA